MCDSATFLLFCTIEFVCNAKRKRHSICLSYTNVKCIRKFSIFHSAASSYITLIDTQTLAFAELVPLSCTKYIGMPCKYHMIHICNQIAKLDLFRVFFFFVCLVPISSWVWNFFSFLFWWLRCPTLWRCFVRLFREFYPQVKTAHNTHIIFR